MTNSKVRAKSARVKKPLTQERLKELLHYDPETGEWTRLQSVKGVPWFKPVGAIKDTGYLAITIDGISYFAHRLAWFFVNGEWPRGQVFHADGDRLNNRWSNLKHKNPRSLREKIDITQEYLKEILSYDPETGCFVWKHRRRSPVKEGCIAGCSDNKNGGTGYWLIGIDGKNYYAHRLAWLYVYGRWPSEQIDHVDCNRQNNSIANLREATVLQNAWNKKRKRNLSPYRGVYCMKKYYKNKPWHAMITVDGNPIGLGFHATAEAAHEAYKAAARIYHGEFARFD